MAKEIKAWLCDFCTKKYYRVKGSSVRHERHCFFNPVTKACASCKNFVRGQGHGEEFEEKHCLVNIYIGALRVTGDSFSFTEVGGLQSDCSKWEPKEILAETL